MRARRITPVQFVRQQILRMTCREFAKLLGVDASVASRYEQRGHLPPSRRKIVEEWARRHGVRIDRRWFEKVPWDPRERVPS
jgi:hypothetical protein